MIPIKSILVVDDDPVSRWTATNKLSNRSGIVIPELPSQLYFLKPEDFGLIIVDRLMPESWEKAWAHFHSEIVRKGLAVDLVEWTCADHDDDWKRRDYAIESIRKTGHGEELVPIVDRWLRTGRVIKGMMV